MKTDLATSVVAAIAGIVIAYFVTNIFTPGLADVSFKTLNDSVNASLSEPDDEIFNFRAVNPTVEVYVGQCQEYNENGECIDDEYNTTDTESAEDTNNTSGENDNGDTN